MQCPYCRIEFDDKPEYIPIPTHQNLRRQERLRRERLGGISAGRGVGGYHNSIPLGSAKDQLEEVQTWGMTRRFCPRCKRLIVRMHCNREAVTIDEIDHPAKKLVDCFIWPKHTSSRPPCPEEVPEEIAKDYNEACLVLDISPRASAALSRRCLQHLLRSAAKVTHNDLSKEIDEVLHRQGRDAVPYYIAENLDSVRLAGNFAAHPIKSTSTGDIVDVEPEEAEFNLSVLELLFQFYFVLPLRQQENRQAIKQKHKDAEKPSKK